MPLCANCDYPLTTEEYRKGWCPGCRQSTSAEAPVEAEVVEATPAYATPPVTAPRPAASDSLPGWGSLRSGLALVAVGSVLMVGMFALSYLAHRAFERAIRDLPAEGGPISALTSVWLNVTLMFLYGATAIMAAGACLCIGVPLWSARSFALANLLCLVLALSAYLMAHVALAQNEDFFRSAAARPGGAKADIVLDAVPRDSPKWSNAWFYAFGYISGLGLLLSDVFFTLLMFFVCWRLRRRVLAGLLLGYLAISLAFQIVRVVILANQERWANHVGLRWLFEVKSGAWLYWLGAGITVAWAVLVFLVRWRVGQEMRGRSVKPRAAY